MEKNCPAEGKEFARTEFKVRCVILDNVMSKRKKGEETLETIQANI